MSNQTEKRECTINFRRDGSINIEIHHIPEKKESQISIQSGQEKVLEELLKWVNENGWSNRTESVACVYSYALKEKIAELRKQGEQE